MNVGDVGYITFGNGYRSSDFEVNRFYKDGKFNLVECRRLEDSKICNFVVEYLSDCWHKLKNIAGE